MMNTLLKSNKYKTKINENKSVYIMFTLHKDHCPNIKLDIEVILNVTEFQYSYLGITLHYFESKRLIWSSRQKSKDMQLFKAP